MNTIQNIKKIALIFFIVTGILHLGSSAFIANEIFLREAHILNKTMDIPFILTGLIYGFASLRIALTDPSKKHKVLDIILISVIIVVLVGLLIVNLLLPDLST